MRILHISFAVFVFIFLLFEALKFSGITLPGWTTSYLNDFLCMPIVLIICLKAVHYIKRDTSIKLSLPLILTITSLYALYFELALPEFTVRYTADFVDVIIYFSGAILYYFLQEISFRNLDKN